HAPAQPRDAVRRHESQGGRPRRRVVRPPRVLGAPERRLARVSAADERAVMSDDVVTVVPAGELVFGIQLPTVALSTMVAAPWERENGAGVPELIQPAQAADRAGFFYVAVCDHVAIPRSLAPAMSTTSSES